MTTELMVQPIDMHDYLEVQPSGAVRIKGHRIGIEHIVERYHAGYSPEDIAQDFPGLSLEKIYVTLAYYLRNKSEVDAYLADLQQWVAEQIRLYEVQGTSPVMQRIRALRAEREREQHA